MEKKKTVIITTVILLILVGYLAYTTLGGTFFYYKTVSEVKADETLSGKPVRVAGKVVDGTLRKEKDTYYFEITDGSENLTVVYSGVLPSTFKDEAEVIAEGTYEKDLGIKAKKLLARCPSKYVSEKE